MTARLAIVPDPPTLDDLLAERADIHARLAEAEEAIKEACRAYSRQHGYGITLRPEQVLRAMAAEGERE